MESDRYNRKRKKITPNESQKKRKIARGRKNLKSMPTGVSPSKPYPCTERVSTGGEGVRTRTDSNGVIEIIDSESDGDGSDSDRQVWYTPKVPPRARRVGNNFEEVLCVESPPKRCDLVDIITNTEIRVQRVHGQAGYRVTGTPKKFKPVDMEDREAQGAMSEKGWRDGNAVTKSNVFHDRGEEKDALAGRAKSAGGDKIAPSSDERSLPSRGGREAGTSFHTSTRRELLGSFNEEAETPPTGIGAALVKPRPVSYKTEMEDERQRSTKSAGASEPKPTAGSNRFEVGYARAGEAYEGFKCESSGGFGWYGGGEANSGDNSAGATKPAPPSRGKTFSVGSSSIGVARARGPADNGEVASGSRKGRGTYMKAGGKGPKKQTANVPTVISIGKGKGAPELPMKFEDSKTSPGDGSEQRRGFEPRLMSRMEAQARHDNVATTKDYSKTKGHEWHKGTADVNIKSEGKVRDEFANEFLNDELDNEMANLPPTFDSPRSRSYGHSAFSNAQYPASLDGSALPSVDASARSESESRYQQYRAQLQGPEQRLWEVRAKYTGICNNGNGCPGIKIGDIIYKPVVGSREGGWRHRDCENPIMERRDEWPVASPRTPVSAQSQSQPKQEFKMPAMGTPAKTEGGYSSNNAESPRQETRRKSNNNSTMSNMESAGTAQARSTSNETRGVRQDNESTMNNHVSVHELGSSWERMTYEQKRRMADDNHLDIGRFEEMRNTANAYLESDIERDAVERRRVANCYEEVDTVGTNKVHREADTIEGVSTGMAEEKRKKPFTNEDCNQTTHPPQSKQRVTEPEPTSIQGTDVLEGGSSRVATSVGEHKAKAEEDATSCIKMDIVQQGNKQYDQMSALEKKRMEENRRKALKIREEKMGEVEGKSTTKREAERSTAKRKEPAMTILRDVAVETGDERLMDVAEAIGTMVRKSESDGKGFENDSNEGDENNKMSRETNGDKQDEDSGGESDGEHSTTSEDDYDKKDPFLASEDESNKSDGDDSYEQKEDENEEQEEDEWVSEKESDSEDEDMAEFGDDSDQQDVKIGLNEGREGDGDVSNEEEGPRRSQRSRRNTKRPSTYKESDEEMIDDYSVGDYNKNAFGSDNDDDASIHTSESGDDSNVKMNPSLKSSESNSNDEVGKKREKNEVATSKNEGDAGDEPSGREVEGYQKGADDEEREWGSDNFSPVIGGRPIDKCTKQVTIGDCAPFYERK